MSLFAGNAITTSLSIPHCIDGLWWLKKYLAQTCLISNVLNLGVSKLRQWRVTWIIFFLKLTQISDHGCTMHYPVHFNLQVEFFSVLEPWDHKMQQPLHRNYWIYSTWWGLYMLDYYCRDWSKYHVYFYVNFGHIVSWIFDIFIYLLWMLEKITLIQSCLKLEL